MVCIENLNLQNMGDQTMKNVFVTDELNGTKSNADETATDSVGDKSTESVKESPSNMKGKQPPTGAQYIALSDIVIDDEYRVRVQENTETILDYVDVFRQYRESKDQGVAYPFPPIRVMPTSDGRYILIAGFHRFFAATKAGEESILAIVFGGSEEEAKEFALHDNATTFPAAGLLKGPRGLSRL
jgi:hypothetical protein